MSHKHVLDHFMVDRDARMFLLLTLGSRRKSAFCSREWMSPSGG